MSFHFSGYYPLDVFSLVEKRMQRDTLDLRALQEGTYKICVGQHLPGSQSPYSSLRKSLESVTDTMDKVDLTCLEMSWSDTPSCTAEGRQNEAAVSPSEQIGYCSYGEIDILVSSLVTRKTIRGAHSSTLLLGQNQSLARGWKVHRKVSHVRRYKWSRLWSNLGNIQRGREPPHRVAWPYSLDIRIAVTDQLPYVFMKIFTDKHCVTLEVSA